MLTRIWILSLMAAISTASGVIAQDKLADVASLIQQLSGETYAARQSAMRDLTALGLDAIPSLSQALCDADPEIRWRAARTLENIGLQGDERTLRKVTRIMALMGKHGVPGLAEKSLQMRQRWLESQVERITGKLSDLGAIVEIVSAYDAALEGPMFGSRPVISIPDISLREAPPGETPSAETASNPVADVAEFQKSIAEIIAADDSADEQALSGLQSDLLEQVIGSRNSERDDLIWLDPSQLGEVQLRNITIDDTWKGTDQDWELLGRVSRLNRLVIASQTMTTEKWKAVAAISSLQNLQINKCEYDLADALAFREKRPDIVVRVVGRGFLGVMGPIDSSIDECVISQVVPETGAAQAGLLVDDKITAINGTPVKAFQDLIFIVGSMAPGDEIKLSYQRSGESLETTAILQPRGDFDR